MRPLFTLLLFALPLVAAPVPKTLKKAASADGVWLLTEFDADGKGGSVENMARDWVIAEERIYAATKQPVPGGGSVFTVKDPAKPTERTWGNCPSVYEVSGDTLRCCYAYDGRKELTECKPGPGIHYFVFTRAKDGK